MRPGRELDTLIAKHVFGHDVVIKRKVPTEVTPVGERPLREYSKEMGAAFDVLKKLNMSLIPIQGGQWFALAGKQDGFESPADFMKYIGEGNFVDAGAGLSPNAPEAICIAAIKSVETRMAREIQTQEADSSNVQ